MGVTPFDWNVVLNGFWNRAILTPSGISKRLFGLSDSSAIEIEVPVDGLEPYKVSHNALTVRVYKHRLIIDTKTPEYDTLKNALDIACCGLESLPETPVHAVGFNLRFKIPQCKSEFQEAIQHPINSLSDLGYEIKEYEMARKLVLGEGYLNLSFNANQEGDMSIVFNFHKNAIDPQKHDDLKCWLKQEIFDIKSRVDVLLEKAICIKS